MFIKLVMAALLFMVVGCDGDKRVVNTTNTEPVVIQVVPVDGTDEVVMVECHHGRSHRAYKEKD